MLAGALLFSLLGLKGYAFRWLMVLPFVLSVFLYVMLLRAKGPQYNLCLFRFGLLNACYVVAAVAVVLL
jgi:hypothetical protein